MKIDKTATAKNVLSIVTALGTGAIVTAAVHQVLPPELRTTTQKVTVPVARVVLGGFISEKTRPYTDQLVDETVTAYKTLTNQINNTTQE